MGQICDPIDGAGQVPCFLRNITAVPTAIACANAALAGCETLTSLDEMAETLLRMYETILERVDFTSLHALSPERLVKIVDYILNGLLAEMVREPDFKPDTYYKEALRYLEELEQMCVLQG